jgi:glycosyltransferase involved in cell wall biosynthesis
MPDESPVTTRAADAGEELPEGRARRLARGLRDLAARELENLLSAHLPDLRVPGVFAGHVVGVDVPADLVFTLGLLWRSGARRIAGRPLDDAIATALGSIRPGRPTGFSCYRIAETLLLFGTAADNRLLAGHPSGIRSMVREACDALALLPHVRAGHLPANFCAVLARCELARQRLGLVSPEDGTAGELRAMTAALLARNPAGFVDDSPSGGGRYDIYSADVIVFSEPLAPELGEVWRRGLDAVLRLGAETAGRDGYAFPWGRSSGVLALCLTLELTGLAVRNHMQEHRSTWLHLAAQAMAAVGGWFRDGLVAAHQYRSCDRYRGPSRRLQMTLDCLGKLLAASLWLDGGAGDEPDGAEVAPSPRDRFIRFEVGRPVGIWSYRSAELDFVLPVVGSTAAGYVATPRRPGLFEVPVEPDLVCGSPIVVANGERYVGGGIPSAVAKQPGELRLEYDRFLRAGQVELNQSLPRLGGRRYTTCRVSGRTLNVQEWLQFDTKPDAVALHVPETYGRPLVVEFSSASPHAVATVPTAGIAEWRSFWSELPRVHQIDLEPSEELRFEYAVTPKLRVLTSALPAHHYQRGLYDPLADRVVEQSARLWPLHQRDETSAALKYWDVFHLHWPEWLQGADVAFHRWFIDALVTAGVKIVWTQHNLLPHNRDERFGAIYQAWASAADGVIHHSRWGRSRVSERYAFRQTAQHRVIPHGHFGNLMEGMERLSRTECEGELDLRPCRWRFGVMGAPRPDKDLQLVLDAFAACSRDDLQLLVLSSSPDVRVPRDDRIRALSYRFTSREEYNRRLKTIDAVILPFSVRGDGLTTGLVGDVVGLGMPALGSRWPFLQEILGDALIPYGDSASELTTCLDRLGSTDLEHAAAHARTLQKAYDWKAVAERTYEFLTDLVATPMAAGTV